MTLFQSFLLGIIQGLTEFIPVSSTGHLLIAQYLLGIPAGTEVFSFLVIVQLGTLVSLLAFYWKELERIVQIAAAVKRPGELRETVVARRGAAQQSVKLWQVADVVDGPEEVESLALYNGRRTLALDVQKSQGENTVEVVDSLMQVTAALRPELPPGVAMDVVRDNSRPIRVSVKNVQRTLVEGALLTIGIVFLFLNSWRSTVITGWPCRSPWSAPSCSCTDSASRSTWSR